MVIDLDHLSKEQSCLFNNNIDRALALYNEMSSDLLRRDDSIGWLVNNVTSRNTVYSNILLCIRYILLIEDVSKTEVIEEIRLSDDSIAGVLRQKYHVVCSSKIINERLSRFFRSIKQCVFCIIWSIGALHCKTKKRVAALLKEGECSAVEVNIFKKSKKYDDRYYGNVLDSLPSELTSSIFYFILYLIIPQRKIVEQIATNTKYKVVYIWDFLRLKDYIIAIKNTRKKYPISLMKYDLLGYDFTHLLKHTSNLSYDFYYFLAHLYVRVIKGMKGDGVNLKLFIDWFENQSYDKSLHWAMNKYYPGVPIHAYIGIMADTKVNPISIATNDEFHRNIAPRNVFVCNQALRNQYVKSGYEGNVGMAPFYRSQKVWDFNKTEKKPYGPFNLYVPLGIFHEEIRYKTQLILDYLKGLPELDVMVSIKMHPSCDESLIAPLINGCNRIRIVKGDFYELLSQADAVVASNSSTTYEALSCGIAALYFVDPENRFCLNKPDGIDDRMWYIVNDRESLKKAIDSITSIPKKEMETIADSIKSYYFQANDKMLTNALFLIN